MENFFITVIALSAVVLFFYLPFNMFFPSAFSPRVKCHICGHEGKAKKIMPGSTGLEILLLLFGVLPGVIYYIYRATNKKLSCSNCSAVQGVSKIKAVA